LVADVEAVGVVEGIVRGGEGNGVGRGGGLWAGLGRKRVGIQKQRNGGGQQEVESLASHTISVAG
jgi:hypothetical protein